MSTPATEGYFEKLPSLIAATRSIEGENFVAPVPQPPDRITGGNLTLRASIDHLAGTAIFSNRSSLIRIMERYFGPGEERHAGLNGYSESYGLDGIWAVAWTQGREECFLRVHGEGCQRLGENMFFVINDLYCNAFKPTRIDLALDDFTRELLSVDLFKSERKNVCNFRAWHPEERESDCRNGKIEGRGGYFGRRGKDGSGVYWRYYDKSLESGGEIDSIRIEPEISGDKCRALWRQLLKAKTYQHLITIAARVVVETIDFRERDKGSGRRERMPRLEWWQRVIDAVSGAIALNVRRFKPKLWDAMMYWSKNWKRNMGVSAIVMQKKGFNPKALFSRKIDRWMEEFKDDPIANSRLIIEEFDVDAFMAEDFEDSADRETRRNEQLRAQSEGITEYPTWRDRVESAQEKLLEESGF